MKNTSCLSTITITRYKELLSERDSLSVEDSNLLYEVSNEINETLESSSFLIKAEMFRRLILLRLEWCMLKWQGDVATHIENQIKQVEFEIGSLEEDKSKEFVLPDEEVTQWVIEVEKFLGFHIDQDYTDMYYFVQATKKMKKHYEAQILSLNKK